MSSSFLGNMPVDQAREIAPGVMHAERDFFAQNSPTRGFTQGQYMYGLGGLGPVGMAKGNRPFELLAPRMALTGPGPFGRMAGGR